MKIESPPITSDHDFEDYFEFIADKDVESFLMKADRRYFYWTDLKYRDDNPFSSAEKAWQIVKTSRFLHSKSLQFGKHQFSYYLTSFIQEELHNFDLKLVGGLYKDSISPFDQEEYFKNSLLSEAIASSQIEGAATTTDVAKEMIKSGRNPRNESEQMIVNNFRAISEIENRLDDDMSLKLIIDIHQLMTYKTSAEKYSGDLRNHPISVQDHVDGEVAFVAPNHDEVKLMLTDLIQFVNGDNDFFHPIVKASILHFMIGYIHPFGDGNGRTARALFYWLLIKKGYTLLRYISISEVIKKARRSYDLAFLKTENDGNDLNYFLIYSLNSLKGAFEKLVAYRDRKKTERRKSSELMYQLVETGFNKRQANLLGFLFVKPKAKVTIPVYSKRHGIVRQTASRDLIELEKRGLIKKYKEGKTLIFTLIDKLRILDLVKN